MLETILIIIVILLVLGWIGTFAIGSALNVLLLDIAVVVVYRLLTKTRV